MVLGPGTEDPGPDGDNGCLRPVGDAELCEHVADMCLHGLLRQLELVGDALVRVAAADQDEHLALAGREPVERLLPIVGRERLDETGGDDRVEQRFAGMRGAYGPRDLVGLRVLQEVAGSARPQRR